MKIRFLGTAAAEGWPGMFCHCDSCKQARKRGGKDIRTRSQSIIDETLLIDFPPDSYWHMMHLNVDFPNIRDVLITHTHEDHLYTDDLKLRGRYFASGIAWDMTLYGNDALAARLEAMIPEEREWLAWKELQEFTPTRVGEYTVTALLAKHNPAEKCFIYQIERDGKSLLYGNDTGIFPEATWEYIKDRRFDLVSLDCTMGKYGEGSNHMGVPDTTKVRERMLSLGCASEETKFVLTHFSHNGGLLHEELEDTAGPKGFLIAYDGFEVEV